MSITDSVLNVTVEGRSATVARDRITAVRLVQNAAAVARLLRRPVTLGTADRGLVVTADRPYLLRDEAAEDWYQQLRVAFADSTVRFERDVQFQNGDVVLAGSLTEPLVALRGSALIVPGSGPIDRDADHKTMPLGVSRDMATALAAVGIASLRYDKRGMAASGGDFLTAGFLDNVADAEAALEFVRTATGTQPILIGHSEGGAIATRVAAGRFDLAGVVLFAAMAHDGVTTMRWQAQQVATALPKFAAFVIKAFRIDIAKQQQKSFDKILRSTTDTIRMQGQRVNAKWMREFLTYDPQPDLRTISVPVLAITGDKDLQVPSADLSVIASLVQGPVETEAFEHLTHLLRNDEQAPSLARYKALIREPMDQTVLSRLTDWALTTLAKEPTK